MGGGSVYVCVLTSKRNVPRLRTYSVTIAIIKCYDRDHNVERLEIRQA